MPFLAGKLELFPWGFSPPDETSQIEERLDWREADRAASHLLTGGTPLVRRAATAFLATARHARLREATSVATLALSISESKQGAHTGVSLGLDRDVLDALPNCVVVPQGDAPHEVLLEAVLTRRGWDSASDPSTVKREATLAFIATFIASRAPQRPGGLVLVALCSRIHNDPRLRIATTAEGGLQPTLTFGLPPNALVEAVPHPSMPPAQLAALALMLRQQRLGHMVLRRHNNSPRVEFDGDRPPAN